MGATNARVWPLISAALLAFDTSAGHEPTEKADSNTSFGAPTGVVALDRSIIFGAFARNGGVELWVSDGSSVGTRQLKDIRAGSRGSYPAFLTRLNSHVLFAADDGTRGIELWRSDGTAEGTEI